MHIAYEAVKSFALEEGLEVNGSELVGLVPLKVILEAGNYYHQQSIQKKQYTERELVKLAVIEMGMDSVSPFDIDHKVLEYNLKAKNAQFLV
jgi:glutamate formiminotransferase / formiminotetrahydrofolate cyclodeaminase